jgi:two-component system response regulator WspF
MRIGIVNDMALAREALRRVVVSSSGDEVAWLAADGEEAIASTRRDTPDLILMDLFMPGTDGAEATRRIMAEHPCPILVVTATVSGHLGKVYEAMGHGALDAVDTPTLGARGTLEGAGPLLAKIALVAKLTGKSTSRSSSYYLAIPPARSHPSPGSLLVAIGASTGGPNALAEILSSLPTNWAVPIVIVQHVDAGFAPGLARWLAGRVKRNVEVIEPGRRPEPGQMLLAATNDHLVLEENGCLAYTNEPVKMSYRPSVDVFYQSLAARWGGSGVAVLLTGMGRDGAAGLQTLRCAGWHTIAQDEATSVVWGMPRAAVELNAAELVLPVSEIGQAIANSICQRERGGVLR